MQCWLPLAGRQGHEYESERLPTGSAPSNVAGAAPQTGKVRGVEQNARQVADSAWNLRLTVDRFCEAHLRQIPGVDALDDVLSATAEAEDPDGKYIPIRYGFGLVTSTEQLCEATAKW